LFVLKFAFGKADQECDQISFGSEIDHAPLIIASDSLSYSVRNAVIGLTRVARLAGRKQARSAAAASIKVALISAKGSVGLT